MDIAFYSAKPFEKAIFDAKLRGTGHAFRYIEARLDERTAPLANGCTAVCAFVTDTLDAKTLEILAKAGCRTVALRSAGFNNVDLAAAKRLDFRVARVPAYSPHAVAEHAVALMLALNRKIPKAYNRVREGNFSIEGLMGFDMYGKTVGIVGTGLIGSVVARIMKAGFGCHVLASDPQPNPELLALGVDYVSVDEVLTRSDVVSFHCPLTPETRHLVDERRIAEMKKGVMLINTSRGALVDTPAVIKALKSGHIGSLGLDVYEEENSLFFGDLSSQIITDDVFMRLLTFPNVLITGHQAFFTREAVEKIADLTFENLEAWSSGKTPPGLVQFPQS